MPRSYMKALDVQLDLIRFWKGSWGPRVADYWVKFLNRDMVPIRNHLDPGDQHLLTEKAPGLRLDFGSGEAFAAREATALNQAATYWVAPPMCDLLNTIRNTMPSYELRSVDIPSRYGFAFLGAPIYMLDKNGKRCNVQAFSWTVEAMVIAFTKPDGTRAKPAPLTDAEVDMAFDLDRRPIPDDQQLTEEQVEQVMRMGSTPFSTPAIQRADGSVLVKAVRFFVYSDKWDPNDAAWGDDQAEAEEAKNMINCQWSLFHVDSWMLNQQLPEPDDPDLGGTDSFLRVVAAFWTMCNQKVTWTGKMGLDRTMRKRAARGMNPIPPDIKVVTLRRMVGQPRYDGDGEPMHFSHSFWVGKETGGFLRNQWYPSEGRHKPKWIMPFIKGDGPLVDKDVIHDVRR